ncbi:MAG: transcriptional regulator [Thomasclavelia sp.]|jgi:NAD-dependent deacetylase|nr:transcriptional regulator [Thomasclavelia sp.]
MIIAFTGAGISKQSNIPTFMDRPDVREKLFRDYANTHHQEYNEVIKQLKANMNGAKPNDAHLALAQYQIPVITMNIDGLHRQAGSKPIEMHGSLPDDNEMDKAYSLYNKPVLYGDPAPNYSNAYALIETMKPGDTLLVIGASHYTAIADQLRFLAKSKGANIIEIQEDAAHKTREVLERLVNNNGN